MIISLAFLLLLIYDCTIPTRIFMRVLFHLIGVIILFTFYACHPPSDNQKLFEQLTEEKTGINFINSLEYTESLNPYTFKNFYNGGGVALGDINNDGLTDIFFSGNMVSNRLYLNKGNLEFEDISAQANLISENVWSTGVSMVDINADGLFDIYVCKSGPPEGEKRYNELFINNGDLTFSEQAKEYGLDNLGLSVHAAFFDYDRDGDLDCYLLNNSIKSIGSFELTKNKRLERDTLGGNKLYRNDNGYFNDVTKFSGIYSSEIGFGLGATIGDINKDSWPDIYISNDFFEKDYLYINQQDGTFIDQLEDYMQETSMGSMGADLADINNDGNPEFFVTEMLPERRDRQVTKTFFNSWEEHRNAENLGYFNQFGRNVLQLNNGDGTFSEIGRYAGVDATDWSWASLIFDIDNDGLKDIFVSNGIFKDLLDLDYLSFMANSRMIRNIITTEPNSIKAIIDRMPSEPIRNYIFKNNGDLTFTNKAEIWGMNDPTFSNGSAYGDLDNDGDLDIVVNNVNMPAVIYENKARQIFPERNFLSLVLSGENDNSRAIGTEINIYIENEVIHNTQNPIRGFESSIDYKMVIGLGNKSKIDSIYISWPTGRETRLYQVPINQQIHINEAEGLQSSIKPKDLTPKAFTQYVNDSLNYKHIENEYNDFQKDRLLFHMNSTEGPCLCKGDVNNDGSEDIYIGGANDQSGQLFIQNKDRSFRASSVDFEPDKGSEDLDCQFFDANGDGNLDLYVASGGSEFSSFSVWLNDRLYFGNGDGSFTKSKQRLPSKGFESTSVVLPFDFDQDGDMDLFVGGRSVPYYYGIPAHSYLLENDGKGNFINLNNGYSSILNSLGMVTDAAIADLENDNINELIVVGRWMPIKVFKFTSDEIVDASTNWGLERTDGWYNTIVTEDVNGDGNIDLIVGNHGLNSRFKASSEEPIELMVNDFDNNGKYEQLISMYSDGKKYPFIQLKELMQQVPVLAKRYSSYNDFKNDETDMLFSKNIMENTRKYYAYNLASGIFLNQGKEFKFEKLPARSQLSPVYAINILDYNHDGIKDVLLGGNFKESKPEVGTYLASYGVLLKGLENGKFQFIPNETAGFSITGSIRDVEEMKIDTKTVLVFTRNNDEIYKLEYVER